MQILVVPTTQRKNSIQYNGKRTAYKSLQDVSGDGGIVYLAKSIPTGEMFQVKVVKRHSMRFWTFIVGDH